MEKRWTKGKTIRMLIFFSLAAYVFFLIEPVRTKKSMTRIANDQLYLAMFDQFGKPGYEKRMNELDGPLITDEGTYLTFQWYKVLAWGDSASIYIDVFKRPESFSWRDKFFWPRVGMNYQWNYFLSPQGRSAFEDVLPLNSANELGDDSRFEVYDNEEKLSDSVRFKVKPNKLFLFLQKGHFSIEEKNDNYTVVDFYEPIADITMKNKPAPRSTSSAMVLEKDSSQIEIVPIIWLSR